MQIFLLLHYPYVHQIHEQKELYGECLSNLDNIIYNEYYVRFHLFQNIDAYNKTSIYDSFFIN